MNATGRPSRNTVLVVGHVVVADHLAALGRCRALPPPAAGQVQADSGVVQPAQQTGDPLQHLLRPQLGGGRIDRHLSLQVGEDLPPLLIQAEQARRSLEAGRFQAPEQPVDRRRPGAGGPPDRGATPPHRAGVARLESNLDLVHHGMTLPLHSPAPRNSAHTSQAFEQQAGTRQFAAPSALTDGLACDA
jgi:hypothetical protein